MADEKLVLHKKFASVVKRMFSPYTLRMILRALHGTAYKRINNKKSKSIVSDTRSEKLRHLNYELVQQNHAERVRIAHDYQLLNWKNSSMLKCAIFIERPKKSKKKERLSLEKEARAKKTAKNDFCKHLKLNVRAESSHLYGTCS